MVSQLAQLAVPASARTSAEEQLVQMAITRAVAGGQEYQVEEGVQSFEVKPLHELVQDIREEAADVVNYATALRHRMPKADRHARSLIVFSLMIAGLCDTLDAYAANHK